MEKKMKYAMSMKIWNGYIDKKTGEHVREHSEIELIEGPDDAKDMHDDYDWGSNIVEWVDDKRKPKRT